MTASCTRARAFRHAGIVVSEMDKALKFYRDLLGLSETWNKLESGSFIEVILGKEGVAVHTVKLSFPEGTGMVELLCFKNPGMHHDGTKELFSQGITHLAFQVDDIDSLYRKLKLEGIEFISPPKVSADGKAKVAFCKDFEGNQIELVELTVK